MLCIINRVVVYEAITTEAAAKIPKDSEMSTNKSKKAQKKEKFTAISSTLYSKHSIFSAAYVWNETSSAQNPDKTYLRIILIANKYLKATNLLA